VCLEKNNHQGWYGECFVQVLAAAAGLACSPLTPDCTGVDFDITYPGVLGEETFPEIKVQVKSWSDPKTDPDDLTQWRYPRLTQKRFNALAGKFRVPRFLFMVVVPEVREQYADADEDRLMLSHAAYWASLEDHERIAEPSCEVRQPVLIPKANLLTTSSLISLFEPVYAVEGAS
jgi:hypothetical protein